MSGIDLKRLQKTKEVQQKDVSLTNRLGKALNSSLNKEITFGNPISNAWKERFYADLFILLSSGLDIQSSLEIIEKEQTKMNLKELISQIRKSIIAGDSLHESLRRQNGFSNYEIFSIQIGEETGRLSIILNDLGKFYGNLIKHQRQLMRTLSYPIMVSATAVGAVLFMLNVIVPMFADVFMRFGGELPKVTQMVLSTSEFMQDKIWVILFSLLVVVVFIVTQRKKKFFRQYGSSLALKIPVIGTLLQYVYLARFCQTMNLLIASKVPMLQSIQLIKKMIAFYPIEESLDKIEANLLMGASLHKSFGMFAIYPPRFVSLVQVGEEVNQLDAMFEKMAEQYGQDVDHKTALLSSVMEPILIIVLAIFVGVILIAMYLPIFQLSSGIE